MTPEQEVKFFALIEQGISLSQEVSDEFLDYLHPELKKMYRECLIKGTETYYEGIKTDDIQKHLIPIL